MLSNKLYRAAKKLPVLIGATLITLGSAYAEEQKNFRMSTLGPGTTPYMVMTSFANTINKNLSQYSISVNATGTATKHQLDASKGKLDFFMSAPITMHLMKNKKAMYKKIKNADKLSENLRTIFNYPMGLYHVSVYEDSGIKTFADIKGKRVFAGPPGGSARKTVETMIKAVTGYEAGKDYISVKLGWDSAAQAFQDGKIDVYANPTNIPSPVISQVTISNKVRFLGIPEESIRNSDAVKALLKRPGYEYKILPSGAYGENQANEGDIYALGVTIGLGTHKDMPEDVIYNMTKTFWENISKQYDNAPWMRNITVEGAFENLNMQLHPGAKKYYEEAGVF